MKEIVFVPKHNWFSIVFLGVLFAILGIAFSVGGVGIQNWFLIIIGFGLLAFGVISVIGRSVEIVISDTEVVIKKLLFPSLVLKYKDFTGFEGNAFVFGNFGVDLRDIINSQEFVVLFSKILEERNIQVSSNHKILL